MEMEVGSWQIFKIRDYDFLQKMNEVFANRVWFDCLQGSYGRDEATGTGVMDVMVIGDVLSVSIFRLIRICWILCPLEN